MLEKDIKTLNNIAKEIRKTVLNIIYSSKSSHVASALSILDILVVLYFKILNINPQNPKSSKRDIFILSKGHACSALYATLSLRGFFDKELLKSYYQDGSPLGGHLKKDSVPGVEVSTGSLGHGLSIGCGIALNNKHSGSSAKTVVLLGDGECNEGSVYEAMMFASARKLNNLVAIVDYNKLQGLGRVCEITAVEPIVDKWKSFRWNAIEINGHDYKQIYDALRKAYDSKETPTVIVANTVKGKGISFMEDKLEWHYKSLNEKELDIALKELE